MAWRFDAMRGFIHPDSRGREIWDLFVLLLTLASAVYVPVQIAFGLEFVGAVLALEIVLSLAFLTDVVLNFFTGYYVESRLVTDRGEIARRYLRTWFVPDLLASLPFFLLHGSGFAEWARLARTLRFLQLHRMLKLARVSTFLQQFQRRHAVNPGLFRLSYFVMLMMLASHSLACGWILIGGVGMEADAGTRYVKALYYTITTLATVGYGDIVPVNNTQRVYAMVLMLLGVGSYSFVIGNLASFLANRDIVRANYFKKLQELTAFLRYRSIPGELRTQVFAYYAHLWESRMGQDDERVLSDLPESLRVDLALAMRRDLIAKVPFFRDAREGLVRDVVMALRPVVFVPGAYIMRQGEIGDSMYIVSSGTVDVVSQDGGEVFATLGEGAFVGEMALVFQTERAASVRARGYCDLYVLTRRQFEYILERHPRFAEHVRRLARERQTEAKKRQGGPRKGRRRRG